MPVVFAQNFIMLFGAAPSSGVKANTKMVSDLRRAVVRGYDRATMIVRIPEVFDRLTGSDCSFEVAASSLLRTIELKFVGNTVTKSFALIIVNTKLTSHKSGVDPLVYPEAVKTKDEFVNLMINVFCFDDCKVCVDYSKE